MKVFISHAEKDGELAYRLAQKLTAAGLDVWVPADEIFPGDNWALKRGQALQKAELMVVLLTPKAISSDSNLQADVQYALGELRFKGRFLTVFVGSPNLLKGNVPWILLKQPYVQAPRDTEFEEVVEEIDQLLAPAV